ncbi:Beta-amylase 2 [Nymphaea thermarum]|nr:Beta-amylase 2 [Nymphaea thermarum]
MAQEMDKLGGVAGMVDDDEDDDEEEEDDDMDMGVKEEEDDDDDEDGVERKKRMMMMGMEGVSGPPGQQHHHFQQLQIQQGVGVGLVQGGGGAVQVGGGGGGMVMRRSRPKEEKERTKLRERHRRAITARILSGLRRHGNYNLRVRADINDVIAALAREAGWMVLPDGTTLPPPTRSPHVCVVSVRVFLSLPSPFSCSLIVLFSTGPLLSLSLSVLPSFVFATKCAAFPDNQLLSSLLLALSSYWHLRGWGMEQLGLSHALTFQNTRSPAPAPTVPTTPLMVASQSPPASSLRGGSGFRSSVEYRPCRLKGVFTPTAASSFDGSSDGRTRPGAGIGDGGDHSSSLGSCFPGDDKQVVDLPARVKERDFAGTPCVPVYVMLPLGVINLKCELVDPDGLVKHLKALKSANVDGVMVDCWWGIVEAHSPQKYNWHGYKRLFQIIHELNLKLQVVMSFHECGGNVGDDVCIPLPHWIVEIGRSNPDIFFTDREGRRNPECLSWGIDKERVLRGRTAVEVYFDYMRSFRVEFDEFFEAGIISEIEIGLGPCGELRYPSYPIRHGWRYPGIGEFQCYDQYLLKSLRKAAEKRGHSFWARGPDNAGTYNLQPHETGFFCDGGDYDSYYGRFFVTWYCQVLIDHADRVLSLARLAFEGTCIAVKVCELLLPSGKRIFVPSSSTSSGYLSTLFDVLLAMYPVYERVADSMFNEQLSGIHWWYKTASHAAELTAGFYNPCNRDGYAPIAQMLKNHNATLNFTCVELRTLDHHEDFPEALADPEGLVWQVLNAAWDVNIQVASENALPCYDRDGYNKILENAKPLNNPDRRHLSAFTYLRLGPALMERHNFLEFERFVKRMHENRGLPVRRIHTLHSNTVEGAHYFCLVPPKFLLAPAGVQQRKRESKL